MSRLLVVGVYPIKKAQHGGQKRVAAIVEQYKRVFDEVRFVGVFPPDYYQLYSRHDIAVKGETRKKTTDSPYTGDITCGQAIFEDHRVKKTFEKLLKTFKPDVIQCEQVFPYLGLKPLLKELDLKPKIILSSQNIEYLQKQEILKNSGYGEEAARASEIIRKCEADMAKHADLVVAVSPEDADKLKAMGGGERVVVAANGIAKHEITERAKRHWLAFKKTNAVSKIATFVGSAHPPNWHGFLATIGDRLGFLPPESKLLLAGSIGDYFHDNFSADNLRPEQVIFWERVVSAGRLSDELLYGLIDASDVLVLPITEGGGSNLKTAEAILSGKKIVATSYAFRSFERYLDLPNIFIADKPDDFRAAIVEAFTSDYKERTKEQVGLAETVQWEYCLQPMIKGAMAL